MKELALFLSCWVRVRVCGHSPCLDFLGLGIYFKPEFNIGWQKQKKKTTMQPKPVPLGTLHLHNSTFCCLHHHHHCTDAKYQTVPSFESSLCSVLMAWPRFELLGCFVSLPLLFLLPNSYTPFQLCEFFSLFF